MPVLTPYLFDQFYYQAQSDHKTFQRGSVYYREGRVFEIEFHGDWVVCQVDGEQDIYEVHFSLADNGHLLSSCTCPQSAVARVCKHMVAAGLAVSTYLRSGEGQTHWKYQLAQVIEQTPRRKRGSVQRYAALLHLQRVPYYSGDRYALVPQIIKASDWSILKSHTIPESAQINLLLDKLSTWAQVVHTPQQPINLEGCLNLPPEGVVILNYMIQQNRFFAGLSSYAAYLPLLAQMDAPVFHLPQGKSPQKRVRIITEPVEIRAALTRDGDYLNLHAGTKLGDKVFTTGKENLVLVSEDPPWVLTGNSLAPVKNPESLAVLARLPIQIPASDEKTFRDQYFRRVAELIPIEGDIVAWEDVKTLPVPRLYLHDEGNTLRADLRFGYGDYEALPTAHPAPVTIMDVPGAWAMVRIHRDLEHEEKYYGLLADSSYRLKRAGREHPYGTFELRTRAHPFDFLMYSIPLLTQAGFEIFGQENLKTGKINRSTPTVRVYITSGIDWFDLKTVVEYGNQQVSLKEIHKLLRRGEKYIKLADGSIGQIPEKWLEKYQHLWELTDETEDGFRVQDFHLPVVDQLLKDVEQVEAPPDFSQRRDRLQKFEQISPHSVPQGFHGELYSYQKAGFDWLHFLREYGFCGILADDMGLGKTIQVLAFLQSLREKGIGGAAVLLVVPKSLLFNWQREAARFTPGLRFLEYLGNFRVKDTASFNEYDVVLTTYGTMLRDVDLLRSYRFHYVILDESQAIKNPLSQSAKAARLLVADHRLAMTGTPLENNTFELWSQFAFLNPGLLGSMEYFKRAFATPIESAGDKTAAETLQKLVYPFIMRRTKDQVAPELPPRTERVLYVDMAGPQQKLYTLTRERYRAELLNLIEGEGLNDARMKILEGLLRLRQIAIHPALVEPTYRGEAPKFDLLYDTLETLQAEKHKALIFSQFVEPLKMIYHELDIRKIPYVYLDGQTRNRQEKVDLFQEDPNIPFFLISLKAGGVGLNLTAADYVIHLDPWWNPAVEMQASDRAHRIGQDKPVFVYKIIARDTVEEKILLLQERKRALVEQLITSEGSFFKSLTKDDVKGLFS